MYYFIPSWYGSGRMWHRDIIPWYHATKRLEFDDTINQVRIFQAEGVEAQLLLPAYMPHARYLLHRQGIFETDYYAVFDDIQGIEDQEMQVLQVKDLDWDDDCEFIYTPFLIMVRKQGQLYAHIEFGIEGFISFIKFFQQEQLERLYIFDDRGFVSSVQFYRDGQLSHQCYLDPKGDWRIREHFSGESYYIEVNPLYATDFEKSRYDSMEELIMEKLAAYLDQQADPQARFVLASHLTHNEAILSLLPAQAAKILSFFVERNQNDSLEDLAKALGQVDLIITDRADFFQDLRQHFPQYRDKMQHLVSYDTRLQLGKSQRRKEAKIYYHINLDEPINDYAIFKVLKVVAENPTTDLTIGVFNDFSSGLQNLENKVKELIDDYLDWQSFTKSQGKMSGAENAVEENQEIHYRFSIKNITDELSLIQELEYSRLIIDLNDHPNRYTQIAGISAGIPQVNKVSSEYVSHLQNGYILPEISDLPQGVHYYLEGLKNWNQSLIYSIDKIRENTGQVFIDKWDKWLKEAGHGRSL